MQIQRLHLGYIVTFGCLLCVVVNVSGATKGDCGSGAAMTVGVLSGVAVMGQRLHSLRIFLWLVENLKC